MRNLFDLPFEKVDGNVMVDGVNMTILARGRTSGQPNAEYVLVFDGGKVLHLTRESKIAGLRLKGDVYHPNLEVIAELNYVEAA